jgi:anti-sigma factor RsiW
MQVQDKIDAYVKNRLSPEEKTAFERDLAHDPALRAAVDQARLDLEVGNLLIRDEVRGWISKWSDNDEWPEMPQAPPSTPHPPLLSAQFYRWMAVAAALILAPAAYWFFSNRENAHNLAFSEKKNEPAQAPNRQQVAAPDSSVRITAPADKQGNPAQATRPANARLIAMAENGFQYRNTEVFLRGSESGRPADAPDALSRAAEALRSDDWRAAARIAEAVPASDPQYADARLLLGQVFFQQKQYAAATLSIQQAIQTGKIPMDQANWNLLMTLVAQYGARKQEADQLLQTILNDPENPFYEDARALSGVLNQ